MYLLRNTNEHIFCEIEDLGQCKIPKSLLLKKVSSQSSRSVLKEK